ncbi:MAG TPA: SDR family NAD(P)-dependent oxidoreductase [Phenylobacterium sp.]|uniref:SDR family NAD(P)-dependent oxidoreductase n=1 Tax=Phenylobacterium sp. TaxID=1871053 RepID=UPI002B49F75D|nr:SDR family NAD(P)-dependent oxidoreductase [Phenylobacterium sp.]HKR89614.1 SDR family NAD(P)-dependent oxidoreductase [Phenylobacterium sp.]HKT54134.1 SDR family NAD(P)-dependent oxidoreductase [Caulobacteraceae bacterium]
MAHAPIFDLSGRVALLTGASSGLGERWARLLAKAGAKVVLGARRIERLEELSRQIGESGGRAIAVRLDVADENSIKAAFDAAEAAFGLVDTIIANAGINVEGSAFELTPDGLDQIMSINVRGVFLTVREGARRLIEQGAGAERGRVVINASITANYVEPGIAAYSASKAAVQQMGKVLARDWAKTGLNVNMLCPGYVRTEMTQDWFEAPGGQKQISRFPRRRLMDESDLDAPLLFLCSDASRAVTGASFTIDDGQSL